MILENQQEKDAFDFICQLASELTSRNGCNDLDKDIFNKFQEQTITSEEIDTKTQKTNTFERKIMYDFDVLHWLKERTRMQENHEK